MIFNAIFLLNAHKLNSDWLGVVGNWISMPSRVIKKQFRLDLPSQT